MKSKRSVYATDGKWHGMSTLGTGRGQRLTERVRALVVSRKIFHEVAQVMDILHSDSVVERNAQTSGGRVILETDDAGGRGGV